MQGCIKFLNPPPGAFEKNINLEKGKGMKILGKKIKIKKMKVGKKLKLLGTLYINLCILDK